MLGYIFRRLLLFIPTLLIISIVAFFLSKYAPGDPVERFFEESYTEKAYRARAEQLGLNKPLFYWSILPSVLPDTFYQLVQPYKREVVRSLALKSSDYPKSIQYYENLAICIAGLESRYAKTKSDSLLSIINTVKGLVAEDDFKVIRQKVSILQNIPSGYTDPETDNFLLAFEALDFARGNNERSPKSHFSRFYWNGSDNQFHLWITNFLQGNFGYSLVSGKEISDRISTALFWTLLLNLSAILLAFLFAIPIGVYAARHSHEKKGRAVTLVTYLLYSLPVFWIATMLLVFFTTPEYGMDWFAGVGLGRESGHNNIWQLFLDRLSHLILPLLCLVYPSLAFISRQLSGAMQDELKRDYIQTARAKGLNENRVVWKHAFRNSLFPLITLFGSILPATIAGSVVIEVIFNIPGMGKLMVDSIFLQDWPVVFIILLLGGILTMTGILLADILYAKLDPRVRLK